MQNILKKQMGCRQVRLAHELAHLFITAFSITVKTAVGKNDASRFTYFSFRMSVLNQIEVNFIISSHVTNSQGSQ